jgi:hypothetical protein
MPQDNYQIVTFPSTERLPQDPREIQSRVKRLKMLANRPIRWNDNVSAKHASTVSIEFDIAQVALKECGHFSI